jgi:nucleoside-diphosphate-sugar epimerase
VNTLHPSLTSGHKSGVPGHVLVLGGAGYLGSVLVPRLLDKGCQVTVMDALIYGNEGIAEVQHRRGFRFVLGDLRDIVAVVEALSGVDAVVHLGGLVGDPACALDEDLTLEINLESTRVVAEAARRLGVGRLIFASTCSVYGASDQVLDEESALDPVSIYARSKMESERLLVELAGEDFAPVILRFGTFFGLSPRARFDLIVNLLAAKAITEGEIAIFGGAQWRPFIHVDDGAEAIIRCLEAPISVVKGQVFNVGADAQNHTLAEIGRLIAKLILGTKLVFQDQLQKEANYKVSFKKLSQELGFVPGRSLTDGIVEIEEAILGGIVSNYLSDKYSNHAFLKGDTAEKLSRVKVGSSG